ncbi:J domain-containing protein [Sandaracinobacteroides saxicola]|uniref:Molecular chaperone DnaJ n=1 Tax=Sandaracinobacteroides saxicola TaxID=2759707 RepID=A0A7G5IKL1_9SPHN|nr:molecular chaperone DnaJ [Sandaracinobacteroides saxicola]QMW23903.1 molecular chaperone DnaJ [Sandaracinobacteroides saxicola]
MGAFALLLAAGALVLALTGRLKRDGWRWVGGALGALLTGELFVKGQFIPAALVAVLTAWWVWRDGLRRKVATLPMDEMEARNILGVGPFAADAEIIAAHRRLISGVHPDRGGSAELARRVNAARDRLLRK